MRNRTTTIQNNNKSDNVPPDSVAKKGFSSFDIQLTRVNASYENRRMKKTDVLHDISFTVHAGRRLIIMGENGSGKTTLLRVLAGLLPYSGSILYGEDELRSLSQFDRASKISLMSQLTESYYPYTVRETVMMGRYSRTKRRGQNALFNAVAGVFSGVTKEDREALTALLADMNLTEIADRRIDTLSGGQLQRIFLARAYAQDTQVLLLDEPMSHLDLRYQDELSQRLLHEKKCRTIVGVFHDLYMASNLAEDIVLLKDGQLLACGEAGDILSNKELLSDAFGTDLSRRLTFI